jgi:serine/threonine protein kinase
LTYFRNLVDHDKYGEPELLKETLGLSYNPKYENLLELIPFDQFEFDQAHPPMRGSRGLVYKASWKRPHKTGLPPRDDLVVVLKTVQVTSEKEREAIFKEVGIEECIKLGVSTNFMTQLDVNFSALQGQVINVTEFYGVTLGKQFPVDGNEVFLVSEYARLGLAEPFLERSMTGESADWEMILRSIWNVASGLNVLHTHGVLHR